MQATDMHSLPGALLEVCEGYSWTTDEQSLFSYCSGVLLMMKRPVQVRESRIEQMECAGEGGIPQVGDREQGAQAVGTAYAQTQMLYRAEGGRRRAGFLPRFSSGSIPCSDTVGEFLSGSGFRFFSVD